MQIWVGSPWFPFWPVKTYNTEDCHFSLALQEFNI